MQYAVPTLALRALAYGANVEGRCVDGTDVLSVYQTVREAVNRARSHRTITIIDCISMRLEGHSLADPFTRYVPAEQLALWKSKGSDCAVPAAPAEDRSRERRGTAGAGRPHRGRSDRGVD